MIDIEYTILHIQQCAARVKHACLQVNRLKEVHHIDSYYFDPNKTNEHALCNSTLFCQTFIDLCVRARDPEMTLKALTHVTDTFCRATSTVASSSGDPRHSQWMIDIYNDEINPLRSIQYFKQHVLEFLAEHDSLIKYAQLKNSSKPKIS